MRNRLITKSNISHLYKNVREGMSVKMVAKKNKKWTTSNGTNIFRVVFTNEVTNEFMVGYLLRYFPKTVTQN
jgi:hypothetical protein